MKQRWLARRARVVVSRDYLLPVLLSREMMTPQPSGPSYEYFRGATAPLENCPLPRWSMKDC